MSTMSEYSDSSSNAESYASDSSIGSSSSEEGQNTQQDLEHLLNRARTNLSASNGDNLTLNEDIVRLDNLDEGGEK